jgi:phosphate transport system protein
MLKQENYQQHISAKFNEELESLRNQMLEMGGVVEQQLNAALDALVKMDSGAAVTMSVPPYSRAANPQPAICVWWWRLSR